MGSDLAIRGISSGLVSSSKGLVIKGNKDRAMRSSRDQATRVSAPAMLSRPTLRTTGQALLRSLCMRDQAKYEHPCNRLEVYG